MYKYFRTLGITASTILVVCTLLSLVLFPATVSALTDETKQKIRDTAQEEYRVIAKDTLCAPADTTCRDSVGSKFDPCFSSIINATGFTYPDTSPPDFHLADLAKCIVGSGNPKTLTDAFNAAKPGIDQKLQAIIDSDKETSSGNTDACSVEGSLAWVACPVSVGLANLIQKTLTPIISSLLYVSPDNTFTPEFKKAWDSFRNIGIALIIIAGLIMVASQAFGLDILDAYTIKKLMPRLAVALIGIALSWPLLRFGITLVNDIGIWAHDLIVGPFRDFGYHDLTLGQDGNDGLNVINSIVQVMVAAAAGTAVYINAVTLGFAGVLSLLGTTALALFIGWLVLAIRQTVIVTAILMAPLAIASYVLPGTQKVWKFWKDALTTSLVMYPIVMGMIGAGEALSRVMVQQSGKDNQFINIQAFIVLIAPYFMLPFAFKLAGGLISTVFAMANDRTKGVFDRSRKFRGETKNWRKGEIASGSMNASRPVRAFNSRTALARQGGISPSRSSRARYKLAQEKLTEQTARERAEKDHGFSLGDTEETRAAIFADDRASFGTRLNQIRRQNGESLYSQDEIERKIARLEAGTGAQMGSNVMKAAAMRGQTVLDGGGWWNEAESRFDLEGFGEAAHHLAERGIFRAEDLGAMLGENQQRPDMGASSFSQRVGIAQTAINNNGRYTDAEKSKIYGQTYQAMRNSSAELANLRTARAVAQQGGDRLDTVLSGDTLDGIELKTAAGGTSSLVKGSHGELSYEDRLISEFATFANYQDMASSASPVAREQFAHQMRQVHEASEMSANTQAMLKPLLDVNGGKVTTQQIMEYFRGNGTGFSTDPTTGIRTLVGVTTPQEYVDLFTTRRREYGTARAAAAAAGGAPTSPATPGGPVGPAAGGKP